MFYFHKTKLTQGQKRRSAILIVEIFVLVLAIFLSIVQSTRSGDTTAQVDIIPQTNIVSSETLNQDTGVPDIGIHHLAFYVDYWNRIRIFDNGIIHDITQFEDCPVQMILSPSDDVGENIARRGAVHISLATIKQGLTVDTSNYEIVVTSSTVTLFTSDNGSYQIALDCAATESSIKYAD